MADELHLRRHVDVGPASVKLRANPSLNTDPEATPRCEPQFGLTPKQYTALSVLAKHPGISSAQLARLTFVTPQAANEMVTTLEHKGFLERSVQQTNRRRLAVELTRSGNTALTKCDALVDRLEASVLRNVGPAEEARFRRTLQSCLETIREPGACH